MTNAIKREWKCGKRQYADNPYDLIELVDSINSDRIGICLDTGHVNTCNTIELSEVVRAFGKRLKASVRCEKEFSFYITGEMFETKIEPRSIATYIFKNE